MKKSSSCLSAEFFTSRGVAITKPFSDWLQTASYLARTRTSEEERERYERWAICTIEDALNSTKGISGTEWEKVSPVMPRNAPDRRPQLLCGITAPTAGVPANTPSVDYRTAVYRECIQRLPPDVLPIVKQAFDKIDTDVMLGRRKYDTLTFMEVHQVIQEFQRIYQEQAMRNLRQAASTIPPSHEVSTMKPVECHKTTLSGERTGRDCQEDCRSGKARRIEHGTQRVNHDEEGMSEEAARTRSFFQDMISCSATTVQSRHGFVGKSQEMERLYSRYEPAAEDIRPRNILEKAFSFVKAKANDREKFPDPLKANRYLSDQLKGMRQDLCVQNIADEFAIEVYEKHALISLELGDIGEFNQCQASLKKMYENAPPNAENSSSDFFCYRLAYLSLGGQHDALATELICYTSTITSKSANSKGSVLSGIKKKDVRRTLMLCGACEEGDCFTITRSLAALPRGMHSLVKIYLQRCRLRWLRELLVGLRGMVSVRFITSCLGFLPTNTTTPKGSKEFWLDGSCPEARNAFKLFFEMIKFTLPPDCSFDKEIKRNEMKLNGTQESQSDSAADAVNAEALFKCVDEYITFLGTRADSKLSTVE